MFDVDDNEGVNDERVVDLNDPVQQQDVDDDYNMNEFEEDPLVPLHKSNLKVTLTKVWMVMTMNWMLLCQMKMNMNLICPNFPGLI
jgi:hypothetical protein